jgi:hypothetical protein
MRDMADLAAGILVRLAINSPIAFSILVGSFWIVASAKLSQSLEGFEM